MITLAITTVVVEKAFVLVETTYHNIDHIASTTIFADFLGRYATKAHFHHKRRRGHDVESHPWHFIKRNHPIEKIGEP